MNSREKMVEDIEWNNKGRLERGINVRRCEKCNDNRLCNLNEKIRNRIISFRIDEIVYSDYLPLTAYTWMGEQKKKGQKKEKKRKVKKV